MSINRARLQDNFSRAARGYDAQARFQHVETRRVYDAARMLFADDAQIVDVGCGTGYFAELANSHRGWNIRGIDIAHGMCQQAQARCTAIQADAQSLPLADESADAVVSSLCLQWVGNVQAAMREMVRVLKPGGLAVVATLGQQSLRELRASAEKVALPLGLLNMPLADDYRDAARAAGFEMTLADATVRADHYANVPALLDSMRRIGAGNNVAGTGTMTGANRWKAMIKAYETLRTPEGIPATWERVFLILRKPA